jgi:hypothetical protein
MYEAPSHLLSIIGGDRQYQLLRGPDTRGVGTTGPWGLTRGRGWALAAVWSKDTSRLWPVHTQREGKEWHLSLMIVQQWGAGLGRQ